MKKITILILISLMILPIMLFSKQQANKSAGSPNWYTDLDQAKLVAAKAKIPILINFTGSDWCIWCKKLASEVFDKKEFNEYAKKNLVLVKIDFPRSIPQTDAAKKKNQALQQKFAIEGYPTIILTDSNGKEINRTGYQTGGAAKYVTHIKGLLANPAK